jgi:hypothetical protein
MNNLAGMPNLKAPLLAGELVLYPPYESGSYSLLPRQISVAVDAMGKPKFTLVLLKTSNPSDTAGQYAVLDLSLGGDFPLDPALQAARTATPDATVKPIIINRGYARLYATTATVQLPADLTVPVPLGWSGPDLGRWTTHLSVESGELIKGAIANQSFPFSARIEFDFLGVVAPLGVGIEFDPRQLLTALLAGSSNRQLAYADLLKFFTQPRENLPLTIQGALTNTGAGLFPVVLADRVATAYSVLAPSPSPTDSAVGQFTDPATLPVGKVQWDLSQPCPVLRQCVFLLDSLLESAAGVGPDLVREVSVPPLELGFYQINLTANLPANRIGVPALGVTLEIPAKPPFRAAAINQTLTFTPPQDQGSFSFQLSPGETLGYTISGFAVIAAGSQAQEYTSPPRPHGEAWIQLQSTDFPVQFSHLQASSRLLQLAQIEGIASYSGPGQTMAQSFTLSQQVPDVAVAVPAAAAMNAALTLTAVPADGSPPVALPVLPFGNTTIDLPSFREYGPHIIAITCAFEAGGATDPVFIELIPDAEMNPAATQSSPPARRIFTPDQPGDSWGYVAGSPFRAGYRYRFAAAAGAPASAWSEVQSPFAPLVLTPKAALPAQAAAAMISQNG